MNHTAVARKFHEWPAATADMTVLPGVLGCRTLRRTVQVRLGSNPLAIARWHSHLHGLATAIHETSGLGVTMTNPKEIPYFVKINGCNNCKVFKSYTSLTGTEYGQDHDLHAKCVHMGCDRYGHNILAPFINPLEYLRIGLNTGLRKQAVAKARRVIARFSEFYDHKGRLKSWVAEALSEEKLGKN